VFNETREKLIKRLLFDAGERDLANLYSGIAFAMISKVFIIFKGLRLLLSVRKTILNLLSLINLLNLLRKSNKSF
jgi:hypothetical protein